MAASTLRHEPLRHQPDIRVRWERGNGFAAGARGQAPRELYFRFGVQYAVRQGDWKLVKASRDMEPMLVNLAADPGEKVDLGAREPERAKMLQALYDRWTASMQPPRWEDQRWNGDATRKAERRVMKKEKKKKVKI